MTIALQLLSLNGSGSQQNWMFGTESVIRIGRSTDNQIVLDSSAISEYHAMLWGYADEWKIVNLSCNGTYLNEKPITHALLSHGAIIRLAAAGPRIRFQYLMADAPVPDPLLSDLLEIHFTRPTTSEARSPNNPILVTPDT